MLCCAELLMSLVQRPDTTGNPIDWLGGGMGRVCGRNYVPKKKWGTNNVIS